MIISLKDRTMTVKNVMSNTVEVPDKHFQLYINTLIFPNLIVREVFFLLKIRVKTFSNLVKELQLFILVLGD